ncbi:DUF2231 domain-containing protein [Labilibaculum euxinus]|uniref:DUF2231 domain-containing protein n=1 Tax=Labilibaculum euxinus TaxID=2686357 RepID=A0A7M4D9S2_9BACT|nr:DUF2231 domain-containing protein [Labilibaculum euxinus]MUP39401.1 DUF2231 domain-containing protein [Labilibaculum euxinus]MVB08606.1 DUF2231 domain-containing protein [Labilibaculum euxinus]
MIPLHPRIVHFPIALLLAATAFAILAIIFKGKRDLFKELTIWNLTLGIIGAIFAIASGLSEEGSLVHNETIHSIMETHKLLGFIFFGIYILLLLWLVVRKSKMKNFEFTGIVVLLVLSSGILSYSAHLGGKMVYEHGAGVSPMEKILKSKDHNHDHNHNDEHQEHDEHKH